MTLCIANTSLLSNTNYFSGHQSWNFNLDVSVSTPFILNSICCCSVTKSCLTLRPHGLQHASPPCPSLSPRVCPSSSPLHQWCRPTISRSVALFSSFPQSLQASGSFPMRQHFVSGGQSIRGSASASVLPVSIQGWSPSRLAGLISLLSTVITGM